MQLSETKETSHQLFIYEKQYKFTDAKLSHFHLNELFMLKSL